MDDEYDDRTRELAASFDMDPDDFLALVEELSTELRSDEEYHRRAARDLVAEAELLLRRVRTVWGETPERSVVDLVLGDDDLSGQEKLALLGYLVCVRENRSVHDLVSRTTASKYRQIAQRLGLPFQVRLGNGNPPPAASMWSSEHQPADDRRRRRRRRA